MRKYLYFILLGCLSIFWWACAKDAGVSVAGNTGKGGSLARFAIVGNYFYAVSNYDIKIYNISTPDNPRFISNEPIGWGIETIFAYGQNLFLGSADGVYLYAIQPDGTIVRKSYYSHFQSCDPVVAEGQYAYSTIRSGRDCRVRDTINELHILNVSDVNVPRLVSKFKMDFPIGLGVDGDYLFVCDREGLRILNVADKQNPTQIHYIKNIDAVDVIVLEKHLILIGASQLTQLDIRDIAHPKIISTLNLK
ncbi:MAG: hypothetical protein RL329_168 [Bacteroidota bacterium]|jgi:hypothetical protein